MADPVWGLLSKAQDDPQTITEAIAAAIAAHEADPTAHLGTGESLEQHRINEVIDHPQASVLMDKYSSKEGYFANDFQTISSWSTSGVVSNANWPGVALEVENGVTETSYIRTTPLTPDGFLRVGKDAIFETGMYLDEVGTVSEFAVGFGATSDTPDAGMGFVQNSSGLRGYVKVGTTIEWTTDLGVDMHDMHTLRAFYSAGDGEVFFYVDGVQVYNVAIPSGTWNISPWLEFWYNANREESGIMKVLFTNFATDLTP